MKAFNYWNFMLEKALAREFHSSRKPKVFFKITVLTKNILTQHQNFFLPRKVS